MPSMLAFPDGRIDGRTTPSNDGTGGRAKFLVSIIIQKYAPGVESIGTLDKQSMIFSDNEEYYLTSVEKEC